MTDLRWPDPRPPLAVPSVTAPPGSAVAFAGQLHPELPREVVWLLVADVHTARSVTGERHGAELALELDPPEGPARPARLTLRLLRKPDRVEVARFVHPFQPADKAALRRLLALAKQGWWHLVVVRPDGHVPAALELPNTLDLLGLLKARLG